MASAPPSYEQATVEPVPYPPPKSQGFSNPATGVGYALPNDPAYPPPPAPGGPPYQQPPYQQPPYQQPPYQQPPYQQPPYQQPPYQQPPPTNYTTQPPYGYQQPTAVHVTVVTTTPGQNVETGAWAGGSFSDKNVRRVFVRKVYTLLTIQLLITFGIVCVCYLVDDVKMWIQQHSYMYWAAYAVFLVTYITLMCCGDIRRRHPTNLILLFIFTLSMGYMVGMITSYYEVESVMLAAGVCAVVCFGITLFAMQTKYDFTTCGAFLCVAVLVLFMFGILAIFTYNRILYTVYACLGALIFSLFLAFDTQMIMGGRRHEISPEEHVYGALCLYLDVVYIFLFFLQIFGKK